MKQERNSRIAEQDAKLAELRKVRRAIDAERASLLKRIEELDLELAENALHSLSTKNEYAPIHILPAEILSLIFEGACHCEERMEINLSRVCRLWRSLSLLTSDLWSTFIYCDRLPKEIDRFSAYLERSRNLPLDLYFNFPCGGRSAVVKQLFNKAVEHVSHWRRFSLVVDEASWPDCDLLFPLVDLAAPHLEWFEIFTSEIYFYQEHEEVYEPSPEPFRYTFRGGSPLLACVRLDTSSMAGCMPLSNVTTLEIDSVSLDLTERFPFSSFLSLFTLPLVNLSLVGTTFKWPGPGQRLVTVSTLKTFRCGDTHVTDSMKYLQAPQLEVLIIRDHTFYLSSDGNTPHDSSPPSFPSLRILSLVNCTIYNFSGFSPLAHATKCATHLYMSHSSNWLEDEEVLLSMATNDPQTILWPLLNTLTYLPQDVDYNSAMEHDLLIELKSFLGIFKRRSKILKTHCILELEPTVAECWKRGDPRSWKRLQEDGFYREMQPRGKNAAQYLPWPPTKFEEIHGLSEDPFLISR